MLFLCLIILGFITLFGGACTSADIYTKGLEYIKWILQSYEELGELKDILVDTEITAEFVSSEGTVMDSAGCNSYFAGYEVEGSKLSTLGHVGATEMYCMEPNGVMDQEQEYLAILQLATSFEINGRDLRIGYDSQVLIYTSDSGT